MKRTTPEAPDPAREQLKTSRAAGKRMNESGARVVQSLREAARQLRNGRNGTRRSRGRALAEQSDET